MFAIFLRTQQFFPSTNCEINKNFEYQTFLGYYLLFFFNIFPQGQNVDFLFFLEDLFSITKRTQKKKKHFGTTLFQ